MTRLNTAAAATTVAVAADYADAMMTARRAKNWLFILLLLLILAQIAVFFLVKFKVLNIEGGGSAAAASATTQGADDGDAATTAPADVDVDVDTADGGTTVRASISGGAPVADALRYFLPVSNFLGITLVIVLAVVLLLITLIMLVGRLIGVSHVTSALIWCVLLIVLLFPWQTMLIGGRADATPGLTTATGADQHPQFKIPGALYTWPELRRDHDFPNQPLMPAVLKWARFVGFPVLALLILLMVQIKSSRGLKFALGESDVQVEVSSPTL